MHDFLMSECKLHELYFLKSAFKKKRVENVLGLGVSLAFSIIFLLLRLSNRKKQLILSYNENKQASSLLPFLETFDSCNMCTLHLVCYQLEIKGFLFYFLSIPLESVLGLMEVRDCLESGLEMPTATSQLSLSISVLSCSIDGPIHS